MFAYEIIKAIRKAKTVYVACELRMFNESHKVERKWFKTTKESALEILKTLDWEDFAGNRPIIAAQVSEDESEVYIG